MTRLKDLMENLNASQKVRTKLLVNSIQIEPVEVVYERLYKEFDNYTYRLDRCDAIVAHLVEVLKGADLEQQYILLDLFNYAVKAYATKYKDA